MLATTKAVDGHRAMRKHVTKSRNARISAIGRYNRRSAGACVPLDPPKSMCSNQRSLGTAGCFMVSLVDDIFVNKTVFSFNCLLLQILSDE